MRVSASGSSIFLSSFFTLANQAIGGLRGQKSAGSTASISEYTSINVPLFVFLSSVSRPPAARTSRNSSNMSSEKYSQFHDMPDGLPRFFFARGLVSASDEASYNNATASLKTSSSSYSSIKPRLS